MNNTCVVCGIEFESKKSAKTCSKNCRVTLSRKGSNVTHNVTLADPNVTHNIEFNFTIRQSPGSIKGDKNWNENKARVRTAKYWYDVPLAAIPVLREGWPKVPEFDTKFGPEPMNGRQYFLWWKNEFDTKDGQPVIYNPFPALDNVTYFQAGDNSRRWGA